MSTSKFFILSALQSDDLHGYEISRAVKRLTLGCCAPSEGALYPVLHEFEAGGYVTCRAEIVNGRERKIYKLTDKGRESLKVATAAWGGIACCLTSDPEKPDRAPE